MQKRNLYNWNAQIIVSGKVMVVGGLHAYVVIPPENRCRKKNLITVVGDLTHRLIGDP